jgi:predicted nucleic acid-binding protein
MQGTFLDTNVFLRYFLNDVPSQSRAARALLGAVENNEITVWTSSLVIAEVVFVLENPRTYAVGRSALRDNLLPLLSLPNLKLERKAIYSRAFDLYVSTSIDFIDAYHVALIEHYRQHELYSFDQHFELVPGITRLEPSRPMSE